MTERRGLRDERGAVVAEFAVALPAVIVVLLFAFAALSTSAQNVRLQDAAADAARIVARGDAPERALSAVSRAVPGAQASISEDADVICVTATARGTLPIALSATGCALAGGR